MAVTELVIGALVRNELLLKSCRQWLREADRFRLEVIPLNPESLFDALQARWEDLDGVLIEQGALDRHGLDQLRSQGMLLPAVVLGDVTGEVDYHDAEVHLQADQLEQLPYNLDAAVLRFLERSQAKGRSPSTTELPQGSDQWRLSQRLEERIGFLGVFYKRDPRLFLRNLPTDERSELLASLERSYRDVLLSYFRDPPAANQAIESFVNTAFFCDLAITRAVEIHMKLIDGWSKQLALEGHKSDFLQDYRLALLDVMAHLCEMYRRSIPPESAGTGVRASAGTALAQQEESPS